MKRLTSSVYAEGLCRIASINEKRRLRAARSQREREVRSLVTRFRKDERGTTAIEYALIAVGISVAILGAVQLVGSDVSALYDRVARVIAGL
jgi:pilus assembly protein Flp/PilA